MNSVAIILATLNGERWVRQQIESIKAQDLNDWHLYIRDDGSADRTLNVIHASSIPPDKYTVLPNEGRSAGSAALCFFLALSAIPIERFDFVALCDQDDVWAPDKLSRAVSLLRSRNAGAYSCDLIAFDNDARKAWYVGKSQPEKDLDYLFQGASAGCTYVMTAEAASLVRARVSSVLDSFPARHSHDWLIYSICRSAGISWVMDTRAYVFYRQHSVNVYGAKGGLRGLLSRARLARSGWYRQHVQWLRGFVTGTPDERAVLDSVDRCGPRDRWWLIQNAHRFRRTRRDVLLMRLSLVLGLF